MAIKRKKLNDQENHERWLVSYADFITLLFAFFAMLYAIMLIDGGRNKVASHTVIELFTNAQTTLAPQLDLPNLKINKEQNEFNVLQNKLKQEFAEQINQGTIHLNQNTNFLALDLDAEILFDSGKAIPHSVALDLVAQIASVLKEDQHFIQVAGFTDDAPITSNLYPSNWELSSARAAKIVRLLIENNIQPQRLSAVGYGEFQPKADNKTASGRLHNRRVVIRILKDV